VHVTPATSIPSAIFIRGGSSAPPASSPTIDRASGPWTASIANSAARSVISTSKSRATSPKRSKSASWLAALETVRYSSSPTR
jgi:hypothetical protein